VEIAVGGKIGEFLDLLARGRPVDLRLIDARTARNVELELLHHVYDG
jgi:hypothetical protein